jgi:hypothetical protein
MTTAGLPDRRTQHERERAWLGTKTVDDHQSSCATVWQADNANGSGPFESVREVIKADGGVTDGDGVTLRTHTGNEYRYSLVYPADWSVEPDLDGGATLEGSRIAAGAAVFVEEDVELTSKASAAVFLDELDADKHVHALELVTQEDVRLRSGQTGQLLECVYVSDSYERWRLLYLFVCDNDTGYTLGIDWNDNNTIEFETTATAMIESFALKGA